MKDLLPFVSDKLTGKELGYQLDRMKLRLDESGSEAEKQIYKTIVERLNDFLRCHEINKTQWA